MDFNHAAELLKLCKEQELSISQVMKKREAELFQTTEQEVEDKMKKALKIMKNSVKEPLIQPVKSVGGLIGGEAKNWKNIAVWENLYAEPCFQRQ